MTHNTTELYDIICSKAASLEAEAIADNERLPMSARAIDYINMRDELADWLMDEHDMDQGDAYDLVDEVLS